VPSPFGVVVRSATRVCPFGPVETRWLLQPTPEVQLPVRVVVPPLGPVLERVRLTVPVPEAVIEAERDHVLPELVVVVELRWQVPPEQLRLPDRVAPRPPGVWNERVPEIWPGVRLILALCDQPGE
jgi:hypothetical protein